MKIIIEASSIEEILGKLDDGANAEKEELEERVANLTRTVEYWQSLYYSKKANWAKEKYEAICKCRNRGLTDSAIRDIFGIDYSDYAGTLDGYLCDLEKIWKLDGMGGV